MKHRWETSRTGKMMSDRSKRMYLPGEREFSLHQIWRPFLRQLRRANLAERAGAISFNVVMAIPPTLIFVFTLIPYLPISDRLVNELFTLIRDIVPGERDHSVIIQFLDDFLNQPRNDLLSFSLLFAIVFSSNAMMGVLRSFDEDYAGFRKRKGLETRRVALLLTLIVFVLVMITLGLLIAHSAVLKWLGLETEWLRELIHQARWVIIFLLFYYIVSFLYRHGPAIENKWSFFTPGAVFATTLMIIATTLVTFWVENFANYNKLYGSIGAIFILMSLVYANAVAILVGFELNVTLTHLRAPMLEKNAVIPTSGDQAI